MASILDRYGIKEVADVTFYELGSDGNPSYPVLYLDTLKVSTVEQTAETTDAKGGKGNAPLITWDYGKEINVTLEDALFSAKSMAMMFGNGQVKDIKVSTDTDIVGKKVIMKTEQITAQEAGQPQSSSNWSSVYIGPDGRKYNKLHAKFFDENGATTTAVITGQVYFCTYDIAVDGKIIEVSANTFPGTYYVTGDTFARAEKNGKDEFFQLIFPKAKITSENTLTLEAEGDPTVFSLNLKILRPSDGIMMKLVKYTLDGGETETVQDTELIHNHKLTSNTNAELESITTGSSTQIKGVVATDQAIFDKDDISEVEFGAGTMTVTKNAGATEGSISIIQVFDKDQNYKKSVKFVVPA